MKTPRSPEANLVLSEVEGGRWTWSYREDTGLTLESNETYVSRAEATDWARRAYPDVPVADDGGDD